MALDFHRADTNEQVFGIDYTDYENLFDIFQTFTHWTGLKIDLYDDMTLTTENQETLLKIIDKYIEVTDLNKDKKKTSTILEFKGVLRLFVKKNIALDLIGD